MNPFFKKSGFTLIEIAFALLVASIGLVGIMSLFPASLRMTKAASDETLAALFADQVLNGVRAQATQIPWPDIKDNIRLPPPTPHIWETPNSLRVEPLKAGAGPDDWNPLHYTTRGFMTGGGEVYRDFSIRYRLRIIDVDNLRKAVYLDVIPGEFGRDYTNHFYMELYNHGQF